MKCFQCGAEFIKHREIATTPSATSHIETWFEHPPSDSCGLMGYNFSAPDPNVMGFPGVRPPAVSVETPKLISSSWKYGND